ncbi:hypothetical protein NEIG_00859 [Nematocida sp. ERTm5]|nr:hypothetical protein NEIG_00859 [Nematocida sp. ERTm5]
MDYAQCRSILDEDSDEGMHPNIDERTFKKWKREKKDLVKAQLRARLEELMGASDETEEESKKEIDTINRLLKEEIVEKVTYTQVASPSPVFEIAAVETDVSALFHIIEVICGTGCVIEYIEVLTETIKTCSADEIEDYLLLCIKHNIQEKYFEAAKRISQCVIALEYIKLESGRLNQNIIMGIQREGAAYYERILSMYRTKE